MQAELTQLSERVLVQLHEIKTIAAFEQLELSVFGRKQGELIELLKKIKNLSDEEKKLVGPVANEIKNGLEKAFAKKRAELTAAAWAQAAETERIDATQPAVPRVELGHLHPNTLIQHDLEDFFTSLGFAVLDGPELESDYYNFTAVNIPPDHPARDSQDTFYIKGNANEVMRTHTSSVQVRAMQKYGAPLRAIVPGKCFRNEATDVRHEHTFYQLEGLVVDKAITFSHLKGVLQLVAAHLYGPDTKVRLRPKFYPFVEPGVNGEVSCFLCKGAGCRVCKGTGWLEILGAGMIHPAVLRQGNINPDEYQGFAFGFGLTRLVMLKYGIEDIRLLESGDLRFLKQF